MIRRLFARSSREGMILLNVLLVIAMASVAVLIMIAAQDIEVQRATRLKDLAQASAYARAGELSAVTTLRRDGLVAAGTDNLTEPWAKLGQTPVAIPNGSFALTIEDEQARFNLNSLQPANSPAPFDLLQRLGASLGVPPQSLNRIATVVRVAGPLSDDRLIRAAGVPQSDLDRLEPYVALLPVEAQTNLNTVDLPLLTLMLQDADAAKTLIDRRRRTGYLTAADLAAAGAGSPAVAYTSDHYRVVTTVRYGDVTEVVTSRLARQRGLGTVDLVVLSRRRSAS